MCLNVIQLIMVLKANASQCYPIWFEEVFCFSDTKQVGYAATNHIITDDKHNIHTNTITHV